jgi:hypothetical protein
MKLSYKFLIIFFLLFNFKTLKADSLYLPAKTANEVLDYTSNLPKNTIIFVDIDDTIITPVSKTFRKPPFNKIIDEIKQDKNKFKNYEEIISNWRLQRKAMLIDQNWISTLSELKKNIVFML